MSSFQIVPFHVTRRAQQDKQEAIVRWLKGENEIIDHRPRPSAVITPASLTKDEAWLWEAFLPRHLEMLEFIGKLPAEVVEQYASAAVSEGFASLQLRKARYAPECALIGATGSKRYLLARWNTESKPLLTVSEIRHLCLEKLGTRTKPALSLEILKKCPWLLIFFIALGAVASLVAWNRLYIFIGGGMAIAGTALMLWLMVRWDRYKAWEAIQRLPT